MVSGRLGILRWNTPFGISLDGILERRLDGGIGVLGLACSWMHSLTHSTGDGLFSSFSMYYGGEVTRSIQNDILLFGFIKFAQATSWMRSTDAWCIEPVYAWFHSIPSAMRNTMQRCGNKFCCKHLVRAPLLVVDCCTSNAQLITTKSLPNRALSDTEMGSVALLMPNKGDPIRRTKTALTTFTQEGKCGGVGTEGSKC